MSIDIRIKTQKPAAGASVELALHDDGYYWFLHPLFERLRNETGKYLDLYGDVSFTRDDYPRLRKLLDEADAKAAAQPPTWKVHVGTQVNPTHQELYQSLHRSELQKLLAALRGMIDTAEEIGGELECVGD